VRSQHRVAKAFAGGNDRPHHPAREDFMADRFQIDNPYSGEIVA
jgi:hypothetical protein